MRETVESIHCVSLKVGLSCPALLYVWQTFIFALTKAKKNRCARSKCLQQLCNQPYNLLVTYTTSDVQASFTQAASIYGQPAANSSTVTLHGVVQGVLLYRWWGAPELGKTHQRAPSFLPVRPKKDRRGSNRDAKRLKWQGGKGLWIHRCKMAGPIGLLVACAFM